MSERLVRELEPRTRVAETWWVVTTNPHPYSFGASEAECRKYQAKHGGELQVTRLTETTSGVVVAVDP